MEQAVEGSCMFTVEQAVQGSCIYIAELAVQGSCIYTFLTPKAAPRKVGFLSYWFSMWENGIRAKWVDDVYVISW